MFGLKVKIFNLNFHSLEVVSRYRDPQLQVSENLCYLENESPKICQCFKIEIIFCLKQLVIQVLVKTQYVYCSMSCICWEVLYFCKYLMT